MQLTKHWAAQLDDYVIDLAWSPDGALLAAASGAGPVRLLAAGTGAAVHEFAGHEAGTNAIGWNPADGASPILATGGQDGSVKFWDGSTGQHTATARLGAGWVEHLAWGGNRLAAAAGRKLFVLNPDGSVAHAFPDAPKTITALAWRGAPAPPLLALAFFGGVRLIDRPGDFGLRKEFPYGATASRRWTGRPTGNGSCPATRIRASTSGCPTRGPSCR